MPSRGAAWSGTLSFGLVSIPVELYPANRAAGVSLRMLDADGTPLRRRFWCPKDEKEVPRDELERGFELDDGRYVVVTDEELERLEPKKTREIDLRLFVERDSLDPLYFERGYFLVAGSESTKAYRLLAAVLQKEGRAGIATFVMREHEYLAAIFADRGLLCLETLRFADELRAPVVSARAKKGGRKRASVERALAKLEKRDVDPDELVDPSAEALRALAEKKHRKGEVVVTREEEGGDEGGEVIDLVQVLKERLRAKAKAAPARKRRLGKTER